MRRMNISLLDMITHNIIHSYLSMAHLTFSIYYDLIHLFLLGYIAWVFKPRVTSLHICSSKECLGKL